MKVVEGFVKYEQFVVSDVRGSQHDKEDPRFTFYVPTQETKQVIRATVPHADKSNKKYCALEEKLKAIEGHNTVGLNDFDMCLVSDLVVPSKFKVLDFEK